MEKGKPYPRKPSEPVGNHAPADLAAAGRLHLKGLKLTPEAEVRMRLAQSGDLDPMNPIHHKPAQGAVN